MSLRAVSIPGEPQERGWPAEQRKPGWRNREEDAQEGGRREAEERGEPSSSPCSTPCPAPRLSPSHPPALYYRD